MLVGLVSCQPSDRNAQWATWAIRIAGAAPGRRGGPAELARGAAGWARQHRAVAMRRSCEAARTPPPPVPPTGSETSAPSSPEAIGSMCRRTPIRVADDTGQYGTTAAARATQAAATGIATAPGGLAASDPHGTNSSATATLVPAKMNRDASRRDRVTCSLQSGARSSSYSMAPGSSDGGAGRGWLTPGCARGQTQRRRPQNGAQPRWAGATGSGQGTARRLLGPGKRGARGGLQVGALGRRTQNRRAKKSF